MNYSFKPVKESLTSSLPRLSTDKGIDPLLSRRMSALGQQQKLIPLCETSRILAHLAQQRDASAERLMRGKAGDPVEAARIMRSSV